jgi:hypothetical protein
VPERTVGGDAEGVGAMSGGEEEGLAGGVVANGLGEEGESGKESEGDGSHEKVRVSPDTSSILG